MRCLRLAVPFIALLLTACPGGRPTPRGEPRADESGHRPPMRPTGDNGTTKGGFTRTDLPASPGGSYGDEVVAALPAPTKQERYEAALLEAVDFLAERKYRDALTALEKAQKIQDTGAVQREMDKIGTILAQEAAAEKAVQDVKTVLDDGKADEAAKLASAALGQYGGGDRADELARLKQQADAVVTAAADSAVVRRTALKTEADAAVQSGNLRAAAVALEQAVGLGDDPVLARQLDELRDRLRTYDDNRRRAAELRADPAHLEEAITRLKAARAAWDTLAVQQELDEYAIILERRRDRVAVADFEVRGELGVPAASRTIAEELMPHLRPRFDLVERGQLSRVMDELKLEAGDLVESTAGRRELARLSRVRYLVVGSLTPIAGVTVHARLVEVPTGLVVQTARLSAPSVEELLPRLKQVALMLQMTDEQKAAFEEQLQAKVVAVKPIAATPLPAELPPPPPPPAPAVPLPPPIVTYTPRPVPLGGLVMEDFRALPPVLVVAPPVPPPALGLVIAREDPRRHRLFNLSLELGDNLFRRGRFHEAQRHFSLALSLGGPRRELALRLDACRGFAPPPAPVVVVPPPVIRPPVIVLPTPVVPVLPPPPVVVVAPPVVRPRVAVFGFSMYCAPGLVPPRASELLADQFASYCGGSFDVIDRGEVCWYMGRLGLTMREIITDPVSRRCLAQALNARSFVYGTVQETASFDVETHLVDADTGVRTGTGKIHVKDHDELKLRLGELAQQVGARPAEQAALVKQGQQSEKALREVRGLLQANQPGQAAEAARTALQTQGESVALRALLEEANRKQRLAAFEESRRREDAARAQALAEAKKRQEALQREAAQARARAEAAARTQDDAVRKQQQAQRERAAANLRAQAQQASQGGDYRRAVTLLESASSLRSSDDVHRELAQAKLAADKAARERLLAEQKKRDEAAQKQRETALARIRKEQEARTQADAERRRAQDVHDRALHDAYLKQAHDLVAKKEYAKALVAAESARRARASDESTKLLEQVRTSLALAEAEKKSAAEKAKLQEEMKRRAEAERKQAEDRTAYLAALGKGQEAVQAHRYAEAVAQYQAAAKLFRTDAALSGLKAAEELHKREEAALVAQKKAKEEEEKRAARLGNLLEQGKQALAARQYDRAVAAYREAKTLAPTNVDVLGGLSRAERERDAEVARIRREQEMKTRQTEVARLLATGNAALAKKQFAAAAASFQKARTLDPAHPEIEPLLARAQAGMKPSTQMIDPKKAKLQEDYQLALGAGRAALKAKNYSAAVNAYKEAVRLIPDDATAKTELAEAVRLQTQALYEAAVGKARQAMTAKRYAEAVKGYDQALQLRPGDLAAIDGKRAAAEALKKRTPVAPPVDPKKTALQEAYGKAMAQARAALKAGHYTEALKDYDAALKLLPNDRAATVERAEAVRQAHEAAYTAWRQRGQQALKERKYAEAVKAFDEALKSKPGDAAAIAEKREAAEALKKTTPVAPPVKPVTPAPAPVKPVTPAPAAPEYQKHLQQAAEAEKAKKYAAAMTAYIAAVKSIKGDPESAPIKQAQFTAWFGIGRVQHAVGQHAEAVKSYTQALKYQPGQPEVTAALQRAKAGKP